MTSVACIGTRAWESRGWVARTTSKLLLGVAVLVVVAGCTTDEPEAAEPVQPLVPSGFAVVESTEDAPGTGGSAYTVTMEAGGSRDDLADQLDAAAREQGFEQQARDDTDDRTVMAYRKDGDVTLTYTLSADGDGRWTAVAVLLEP